jgi:hypothetical protein
MHGELRLFFDASAFTSSSATEFCTITSFAALSADGNIFFAVYRGSAAAALQTLFPFDVASCAALQTRKRQGWSNVGLSKAQSHIP